MRALVRLVLDGFIVVPMALFAVLLQHALRRFRSQGRQSRESGTTWNEGLRRPAFLSRSL